MPEKKPKTLIIRSYQVGFGDCFLLTFRYPAAGGKTSDRHLLIDCGSTGMPATAAGDLKAVAKQVARDCGGKLDAVVATHRHADHINGFETSAAGTGPGDTLRALRPELVVQPWTEDPKTAKDAKKPTLLAGGDGLRLAPARFVLGLEGMHAFAEVVRQEAKRLGPGFSARARRQLGFLGEENLKNLLAVKNLMTMGKKQEYLHYGEPTALNKLFPGVKVHVLGPPTPIEYPDVEKQRSKDSAEFWHILGLGARPLATASGIVPFAKRFALRVRPAEVRWFVPRIKAAHATQRLELVRILDTAMNNTSLILLFEIGSKKFLFPGDAQIENWSYALKDAPDAKANQRLLAETDFYKVGHHGSLNATPKTLWNLFKKKGVAGNFNRLSTAVSTMAGKHGNPPNTEVPRGPLVTALKENSTFFSTQSLKKKSEFSKAMQFEF